MNPPLSIPGPRALPLRILWLALLGVTAFSAVENTQAQIQLELKMDRKLYLSHEPVSGKLRIINRAGIDIILGQSEGLSWLDFTVLDGRGHLITPIQKVRYDQSMVLAAGQTHEMDVVVNQFYPMDKIGVYKVKASVNFPQIKRVFETPVTMVQITDGQAMWSQIVGVPQGHPKAGSYREYSLMTYYHGARQKTLYMRLKDNDSGMVIKTYPVGDYLSVRKPAHAIDRQNNLHVLHMSAPNRYTYTVIDIDGERVQRETYYSKGTNRPELATNDFGDVQVQGGLTPEEASQNYEQTQFHRLSERPPGLPRF